MAEDASLTERFPILISGSIGAVISQVFNVIQQFCHCLTAEQLSAANALVGTLSAAVVMFWQYRNVWSKASVEKVAAVPHSLTLEQAEKIVEKK